MDIYKIAAQKGIRFPSNRGQLIVEQLFDLPLKNNSGFDLDSIARTIHNELKEVTQESFVEDTTPNLRQKELEVSLDIVKDVIKTKLEENTAQLAKIQRATERKKILDAIMAKKDSALSEASLEELEKKLAEID